MHVFDIIGLFTYAGETAAQLTYVHTSEIIVQCFV